MKYLRFFAIVAVVILGLSLQTTHDSPPLSDSRLKTDVEFLFKSPSGINVYSFKYIDDPSTVYQGVMAQELLGTAFDGAVIRGERYYAVDYTQIDVAFKKITSQKKEWWQETIKTLKFIKIDSLYQENIKKNVYLTILE